MGRSLKDIFTRTYPKDEECWNGLEFRELIAGDKYISLPIPGDNKKSGSGFRNPYYLFQKIQPIKQNGYSYNCVELWQGRLTYTPDEMPVIKIK
jgi:hypothetical protein